MKSSFRPRRTSLGLEATSAPMVAFSGKSRTVPRTFLFKSNKEIGQTK
ncbi:MAG: hypothetical protein GW815_00750 [Candidatus Moranbacteria bacterium]|nr:hypothetical protein [Candidatus Moranbacteria bacterium]